MRDSPTRLPPPLLGSRLARGAHQESRPVGTSPTNRIARARRRKIARPIPAGPNPVSRHGTLRTLRRDRVQSSSTKGELGKHPDPPSQERASLRSDNLSRVEASTSRDARPVQRRLSLPEPAPARETASKMSWRPSRTVFGYPTCAAETSRLVST